MSADADVAILRGVLIQLYYNDHEPPDFHARGRGFHARIAIADGAVIGIDGLMPAGVRRDIMAWAARRRADLQEAWQLARQRQPLKRIAP